MRRAAAPVAGRLAIMLAALLATLLAGCSSGSSAPGGSDPATATSDAGASPASSPAASLPPGPGAVTIGSAGFGESVLLANIYAGAMAAQGVTVTRALRIGERGDYMVALAKGRIDAVPEYSGSILAYLNKRASAKAPDEVYAQLRSAVAARGYAVLNYAAAQDSDTITVTRTTAERYGLRTIADLKDHAAELTLGAPAQFHTRVDGVPALHAEYGFAFGRFVELGPGSDASVQALRSDRVDAADIFSTSPAILRYDLVSLQDPKSMFAAQNVVPLFRRSVLTQPMADACNTVSAKLDTATLAGLDAKIAAGRQPAAVAAAWLHANHLD